MPSKTDFNVSPYFDDFTEDKNFIESCTDQLSLFSQRITTQQSILQNHLKTW